MKRVRQRGVKTSPKGEALFRWRGSQKEALFRWGGSRRKGAQKQVPKDFMEAIISAAEQSGEDKRGRGGLVGYFCRIARTQPKVMAALLARIPPDEIIGKEEERVYKTEEEVREALRERGLPVDRIFQQLKAARSID